jgi:hypothetical protein
MRHTQSDLQTFDFLQRSGEAPTTWQMHVDDLYGSQHRALDDLMQNNTQINVFRVLKRV